MKNYYVIDFDSTFTKVEALDELCEIVHQANNGLILKQIKEITDLAMEGKFSFSDALDERIKLLKAHKKHIPILIETLKSKVSESTKKNKAYFEQNAANILIVSGGFKDFIVPVVIEYGIKPENVYANTFVYDSQGNIIGVDKQNLLSQDKGKVKLMKHLNLDGEVAVIGDGYTDYEIKEAGYANKFYAFVENIARPSVTAKADVIAHSFDEIFANK
jgi:D-3-phosphoglycerate dehydrogenase